jgi:predicted adenylyl cyclase CyaB
MPANIEVKAALKNRASTIATAERLANCGPEVILQEDVFFRCEDARLKLRIFHSVNGDATHGELIRYQRENRREARRSQYSIARTQDPQILHDILKGTLGVIGTVKKTRTLYLAGQTRIHIDEVEELGDFLELEVVLREGQTEAEGKRIGDDLLREFEINPQDLIAEAYIDLLAGKAA